MRALLVVDYTVDFVADDGKLTCGKPGQQIEQAICEEIAASIARNEPVFVLNDLHYEGDTTHPESKLFPPHNIAGTPGRELYGAVKTAVDAAEKAHPELIFRMDKTRYSAFVRTGLEEKLREKGVDTVIVTGVCTDICILHTAIGAYNCDFNAEIPTAAVASFNPQGHEFALAHMKNSLGATIR